MEDGKKTHKCPIDGKKYDHPGKCPDHAEVDLVMIEEGEEGAQMMEEDIDEE